MGVVSMKNSMFVHLPKCAGRSISAVLYKNVSGASYIGGTAGAQAHALPPIGNKTAIVCVRHPIMFLNSLWEHRKREKFNWKISPTRLEKTCGGNTLESFFECVSRNKGVVTEYFNHWADHYPETRCIRLEHIQDELTDTLHALGESFNQDVLKKGIKETKIGWLATRQQLIGLISERPNMIEQIIENEQTLFNRFNYSASDLKALIDRVQ